MRVSARMPPVGRRARTAVTLCNGDADDAALVGWWGRWRYAGRVMWALRDGGAASRVLKGSRQGWFGGHTQGWPQSWSPRQEDGP